jgi:hypothetical protein
MEDNSDVDSDGSDIDIGNFDENDDFELREVNRNDDEWLEAMFDSDSDNDKFPISMSLPSLSTSELSSMIL